jgi:hypothetical protein
MVEWIATGLKLFEYYGLSMLQLLVSFGVGLGFIWIVYRLVIAWRDQ